LFDWVGRLRGTAELCRCLWPRAHGAAQRGAASWFWFVGLLVVSVVTEGVVSSRNRIRAGAGGIFLNIFFKK
jgi:hypothetical protein